MSTNYISYPFRSLWLSILLIWGLHTFASTKTMTVDVCIYGATSAGVMSAYTARQMGVSVLLIDNSGHIGGLTTGGLGFTDIGNKSAITGLARDFYRRIGRKYDKFEQWVFEPHVASAVFAEYLFEADVEPLRYYRLVKVHKLGTAIKTIELENTRDARFEPLSVKAKQYIDCTYEGDLMVQAGVSYRVGREANDEYGEQYNGVQLEKKHQFPDGVDPYIVKGDSTSGLLWGISSAKLRAIGSADSCVQAYNYRICLTEKADNKIEITMPQDYRPERYELLLRYLERKPAKDLWAFLKPDRIGNGKTDVNNNGPFSTDMIGMNHNYSEATYAERERIRKDHENYTKGFLYFIGNDLRMPEHLRLQMKKFGYPKDEYVDNGHWSPQMYVREARRMVGDYVMTQANCQGRVRVTDGIGMAAYTMDSHNCQRLVVNGMVKNEGDIQVKGFSPYPISYRSLLPKAVECTNLTVPVALSATHIAYGSIRMEPVFMVLGQSAAVAAVLSVKSNRPLHSLDVRSIQRELNTNPLATGAIADLIIDNEDNDKITLSGEWITQSWGYGGSMLMSKHKAGITNSVTFHPQVLRTATYRLYVYLHSGRENAALVTVNAGNAHASRLFNCPSSSSGQHSNGDWVAAGDFFLSPSQTVSVEVAEGRSDKGIVVDAILFVPLHEPVPLASSKQWSVAKAQEWYARQPLQVGCNYLPRTAINQIEMWQEQTWDPLTIDQELGWGAALGMNSVRVYLHDLVYRQDKKAFLRRIDQFLSIADRHSIRTLFVLWDDCHFSLPQLGVQTAPMPGVHNSGWLQSPGYHTVKAYADGTLLPKRREDLKEYVKTVLKHFRNDKRILGWDLYNEVGNNYCDDMSLSLLNDTWEWAWEVRPSQPLTACVNGASSEAGKRINASNSDIYSFHNYDSPEGLTKRIEFVLADAQGRPAWCTEFMGRQSHRTYSGCFSGSTFESCLPLLHGASIGGWCWGLVDGKSGTKWDWGTRRSSAGDSRPTPTRATVDSSAEPPVWFHDLLRSDGTPFDPRDVEFLKIFLKK